MTDPSLIDRENWDEHYVKRGDPSKPTYYIIRRKSVNSGLFSGVSIFLGHIRYALSKGWIPVIDMQNYGNPYLAPEKFGKENAWEYYFEQPFHIGLEQAYSGENIVLASPSLPYTPWASRALCENQDELLTEWKMFVKLGLLKVKDELMAEISAEWKKLFAPTDRVLGVLLRGTDYVAGKPFGHPIPPF